MRSSHNRHTQTSFLGYVLCDANRFTPLIKQDDKGLVRTRCPGDYHNMVDCHCEDIQLFINEVHGLEFDNKRVTGPSPLITDSIPVIPRDWFNRPPGSVPSDVVGIRLGDILSHKPYRNSAKTLLLSDDVQIDLSALQSPVFQGKKIVLFATGIDVVIEKLWHRRLIIGLFQAIAAGGFYAVTGMNFSLFLHECPLGHLINLNKSLVFCEELSKLGIPVIPHIYAITDTQRDMWIKWLNAHPNIKTVLINTQMQRDRASMYEAELTVNSLLTHTNVNVVLNGRQPLSPSWHGSHRVIMATQFNLKKQAIVENARKKRLTLIKPLLFQSQPRTGNDAGVSLRLWAPLKSKSG